MENAASGSYDVSVVTKAIQSLLQKKALFAGGWVLLFFGLERVFPAEGRKRKKNNPREHLRDNLGLWAVNILVSPLIVLPFTILAASIAPHWRPVFLTGPAVDVLLLDFWIYWWHRANHEIPFLWRFHEVHHLDRDMDSTTALRFHFGEVIFSALFRSLFIFLLGIPVASVVLFEALVLAVSVFHHSALRLPPALERALSRIVVTPSLHWVHHHARRADTDSTYATILSVWDYIYGTRSATARTPDMKIGVEGQGRDNPDLARLLLWPFVRP